MNNRHIFKVGEEVIALVTNTEDGCQHKYKGKLYKVLFVRYCGGCGEQLINIGGYSNGNSGYLTHCCGFRQASNNIPFTNSTLFIRPEHLEDLMIERVNEENYEGAAEIKEMIEVLSAETQK